ncbi:FAD-binding oxidoreductase [Paracoccus sp. IB05]|nr:FAD-binding oxidoreductase [Paracoccus sp. IB05]
MTATVEAGVFIDILRTDRAAILGGLPVSFAATGSAMVGGSLATNTGGAHMLRAGIAARRLPGLEVVLADGSVVSRLDGLHKDNSGLNRMQLFTGSERCLGIITKADLKT